MNRRKLIPVFILLVALVARLYQLDFRALWWDEGLSLLFARLDYVANARMAVTLADTNPPVYRLLLGVWINLVGSSAWAARLFSALPGVMLVAVIFRLTRTLRLPRPVAVIAMSLSAASPMLIYYSQEAKGYSWVALAGTASVLVWLLTLTPAPSPYRARGAIWLLWAACLLLAIGSHYISVFLIAVENLWTLILTLRNWRGHEKRWLVHWGWQIGSQVAVALCLLPFVVITFGGTSAAMRGETGEFNNLGPSEFITQHILELTQGPTASGVSAGLVAVVVIGIVVIGYWRLEDKRVRELAIWDLGFWNLRFIALTWIIIPIGLGFVLNSYHSFFFPRFVLYVVPAILILIANGIWQVALRLSQSLVMRNSHWSLVIVSLSHCLIVSPAPLRYGAVLFIALLWSPTLVAHYNTPTAPGEDWRPIAKTLQPLMRAGDAAVYTWGWIPGYLEAYLPPAPQPTYTLGFFTPESLDDDMQAIVAEPERVWLFDYEIKQFDVRNLAGNWLRSRAALVYDDWPGGQKGHVALFVLKPTATNSPNALSAQFSNGLRFTTAEVQAALAPGDALTIPIAWQVRTASRP